MANVPMPPWAPSSSFPTIQTLPGEGTTPANRRSSRNVPFVGLGLGAMVHEFPSQCKSSVIWRPEPLAAKKEPNAQMSLGEFAVNPSKRFDWLTVFGPTLGLGTTFQLVPSKCSISVSVAACFGGATGVEDPTAHTLSGASESTAFSMLVPAPALGVATSCQLVPSQ